MYDDLVEMYVYYNIPLRWILYLYFMGGNQLLLQLSGPLDMPYSVELQCVGTFVDHVELNTHWMMGPVTE